MRKRVLYLIKWNEKVVPKRVVEASSFLRNMHGIIKVNPQFETKIEVDLLKNSIEKWKGQMKERVCIYKLQHEYF